MKVNELNIKVTKAVITSVTFQMEEEKGLVVNVHGSMFTDKGLKVSEFNFYSDGWSEENKIVIPIDFHMKATDIFEKLTPIIYEKINGAFKSLPAPK
jgi:hypothetical protein